MLERFPVYNLNLFSTEHTGHLFPRLFRTKGDVLPTCSPGLPCQWHSSGNATIRSYERPLFDTASYCSNKDVT